MKNILLLHGAIGHQNQFWQLAKILVDDYKVHSLNFSGHGDHDSDENFSINLFANDVLDYLTSNNLQKIDIFGYSMGGYVAIYLARFHPGKIGRIFTLATKFLWTPEIASSEIKMLDPDKIEQKLPAFASILAQRHGIRNWKNVLNKTAVFMTGLGDDNPLLPADYRQVENEIKLALGDADTMVTLSETQTVADYLPNAAVIVLLGTAHALEKTDINLLAVQIRAFLTIK